MTTTEKTYSDSDVRTVLSGARRVPNPEIAPTQGDVLTYRVVTSRDFLNPGLRFDLAMAEAFRVTRNLLSLRLDLSVSEILAMAEALYVEREMTR
jgi:hypothetical protein